MKKSEFFARLALAFPDELLVNEVEIRFYVFGEPDEFDAAVRQAFEHALSMGKDLQCEPKVSIEPTSRMITIRLEV